MTKEQRDIAIEKIQAIIPLFNQKGWLLYYATATKQIHLQLVKETINCPMTLSVERIYKSRDLFKDIKTNVKKQLEKAIKSL